MNISGISTLGRYAQGVRLIKLGKNEEVATVARVQITDEEEA
jgi:DNA gyrase subunit A